MITKADVDKALEFRNMDREIEKLSEWDKQDIEAASISSLPDETFPPEALHSFVEVAQAYGATIVATYGKIHAMRPKTRYELESLVRDQIRRELQERGETDKSPDSHIGDGFLDNAREVNDTDI